MSEKKTIKLRWEYLLPAILIVAIIAVGFMTFGKKTTVVGAEEYVEKLERKMASSLSKISGAGEVTVMISVDEGVGTIIAEDVKITEENGKTTKSSSPVLVGGKPIVLGEKYPEIKGVVVVCKGAGNIRVKMAVLDAVTTMFGIPANKVQILAQ